MTSPHLAAALLAALLTALAVAVALRRSPPAAPAGLRDPGGGRAGPARTRSALPGSAATWAGVAAATGAVVLLPFPWALAGAPVVGWAVRRRVAAAETGAARRRRLELEGELPLLVDLVGALLVAGTAPEHALARVRDVLGATTAAELAPWVERLRLGDDPARVWSDLAQHPQLGRLGRALHRAGLTGSPVAEALLRLGDDLRSAARAESTERVRRVEVRATAPLALCLLPSFVLLGVVPLVAGTIGRLVWS